MLDGEGEEEADHRNEHLLGVELVQVLVEDGPKVLVQRGPDNDGSPGHVWGVGVVHGVLYHAPLPGVKVQHHLLPHHDLLHTREGEEGGGGGGGEGGVGGTIDENLITIQYTSDASTCTCNATLLK